MNIPPDSLRMVRRALQLYKDLLKFETGKLHQSMIGAVPPDAIRAVHAESHYLDTLISDLNIEIDTLDPDGP